jgi:hypothetical protein
MLHSIAGYDIDCGLRKQQQTIIIMLPSLLLSYCSWPCCLVVGTFLPVIGGGEFDHLSDNESDEQGLLTLFNTCPDFLSCAAKLSLYNLASLLNYLSEDTHHLKNSQQQGNDNKNF